MKRICLAILLIAFMGCVTPLKQGAENVRLTYNTSSVEGCEFKGEVKAKSRSGGTLNTDVSEEDALNKIKNSAYDLGANVVLMSKEGVDKGASFNPYAYGGVMFHAEFRGRGEAYFCDPNKDKETVKAPPTAPSSISIVQEPPPKPAEPAAKGPDAPYDFRKAHGECLRWKWNPQKSGNCLKRKPTMWFINPRCMAWIAQ